MAVFLLYSTDFRNLGANYLAVEVVENGPILFATECNHKNIQCVTDGDILRGYRMSAVLTKGARQRR